MVIRLLNFSTQLCDLDIFRSFILLNYYLSVDYKRQISKINTIFFNAYFWYKSTDLYNSFEIAQLGEATSNFDPVLLLS